MSAMGGMFAFGGGSADAGLLAALGSRLERLGPDGGREATAGSVGMAYRAFHTNAESRLERQPLAWGLNCLLTWDGRLDNREELVALLGDGLRGDRTDVAIVQAAYVRWGTAAFGRIVGDFALALWDSGKRALFLARDCVGTRTLYYHVNRDRILWSTDLGPLLDVSGVPLEVNDEYVAGFLARGPDAGLTPYVNVHAVKPAFYLRVDVEGLVSAHRFWALDPDKEIRYRTDAEYEEHFRHLFREAVRVRLRSDRPVFAELSGGLDSSSIVCMADDILRAGEAEASRLETVSYVYDRSSTSDESRWIGYVEEQRRIPGHHVLESSHPYVSPTTDAGFIYTLSFHLAVSSFNAQVSKRMAWSGAATLLSGRGGDELFHSTNSPLPELADLCVARRFPLLHQTLKEWSRTIRVPYLQLLRETIVRGVAPPWLRLYFDRQQSATVPGWIPESFATRYKLRERMICSEDLTAFALPSRRDQAIGFLAGIRWIADGHRQELSPTRVTYPCLHRPLVEFQQAIPFSQNVRPGQSRSLMRRALHGVLPPRTLARKGKCNPSEAAFRSLAQQASVMAGLFNPSQASARGYVEDGGMREALALASCGSQVNTSSLLRALALELWLRVVAVKTAKSRERRAMKRPIEAAFRAAEAGAVGCFNTGTADGDFTGSVARWRSGRLQKEDPHERL